MNFFPSSHTQPSGPAAAKTVRPASPTKGIAIEPLVGCAKCEVWFLNESGQVLEKNPTWGSSAVSTFTVPKGATKFGIVDDAVNFQPHDIPSASATTPTFEFSHKYNAWKDFRRGLGDYDIRSYDAVVKPKYLTALIANPP